MAATDMQWRGPDAEEDARLGELISSFHHGQVTDLPATCPGCDAGKAFHFYYHQFSENGPGGGGWAWCDACRVYLHWSGIVPGWWINPAFIEFGKLASPPNYLNDHAVEIDRHCLSILPSVR